MHKPEQISDWVDRYLRNGLTTDEEAVFEAALLDSPDLQLELETALGIRQAVLLQAEEPKATRRPWLGKRAKLAGPEGSCALFNAVERSRLPPQAGAGKRDSLLGAAEKAYPPSTLDARNHWQPLALAASVVLAVFSTTMYWQVSNKAGTLQSEITAMSQPRTSVLTVPVDIMRSADSQTPDVMVRKPEGNALLVLDVELSPAVAALGRVRMSLRDAQAVELLTWDSGRFDDGRVTVAFDARKLPDGKVWLEMSDGQGRVIDRRLLEFLPSR
jgi:hypothetical protein